MTSTALRKDIEGIAIVTLNRPEKLNAINSAMREVILHAVNDLRDRDDLRVLLINANGRYFSSGIDINREGATAEPPIVTSREMTGIRREYRRNLHMLLDEIEAIEKPVVMAIHGPCLGLGLEMAASADFRLASDLARFGLPEINLGVIAGSGGVSRVTRLCGPGWSKWLNMAGEQIDAKTAHIAGLVQAIYPSVEFEQRVWEFCQKLASISPEVIGAAKLAVELSWDLDRTQARNIERIINTPLLMSDRSNLIRRTLKSDKKSS